MSQDWFDVAFGELYPLVYRHRSEDAARDEVAWVVEQLGIAAGTRVLDAACGAGRHSRAVARSGAHVIGLDRSLALLQRARSTADPIPYVRGDLRELPFVDGSFGCVLSLFTSFGYFDDAGNDRQLGEAARVLRRGGRYLLDYLDADHVRANLVPRSERVTGEHRIVEERELVDARVEKSVRVLDGSDRVVASWRESVRLYAESELRECLERARLTVERVVGALDGTPRGRETSRMVFIAERR